MRIAEEYVIDTCVLQKANGPIEGQPRPGSLLQKRLALLTRIRRGEVVVLYSRRLLTEYRRNVSEPRNDYVKAFYAILADPDHSILNWPPWPSATNEKVRQCRFPPEDKHVLRTAYRPNPSAIITEEIRMLQTDKAVYRVFRVHVWGI